MWEVLVIDTYKNTLFRLCLINLGNPSDAEDVVQETFIRYFQKAPDFENAEHEKAWLITVAINKCRDMLRFRNRYRFVDFEEVIEYTQDLTDHTIIDALLTVPNKFKLVLVLYYVEEYSVEEIAKIIGKTSSAVKMRLQKGRRLLREAYEKEAYK